MLNNLESTSIHQLVESQALQTPDAVAVIFGQEQLTYRELNQKANQLAHYLQTLNVGPEVLVGVCLERSLSMLIGLLGVLKAGGAYVPLDPSFPQERLAFMLEDSEVPVLLTQQHLLEILPEREGLKIVCIDTDWQAITQHTEENLDSPVSPENLAYTIYTSGSTGKPKGVQIVHRAVVNLLKSMQQEPGLTQSDIFLGITTISFDMSVPELYLPLIVGARIVLVRREAGSDPAQLSKILSESGATVMQATPATWQLLLSAGWKGNKQLKMLCGGEAMTRSLADQLLEKGGSVWQMYGPTETTVWSAVYQVKPGINPVPIGYPIANTQIYLIHGPARRKDDLLQPVRVGEPGEVYIGGVGLARGYLNRPELTSERFIHDPFSDDPDARLYKTGDLARYLPDGSIEFIGRIDYQVKIRGFRVELGDIEAALSQYPVVTEAAVVAKEDASGSKCLVAYIVPKLEPSEKKNLVPQLRVFLKEKLPNYMVPSVFVVMESLPLTPSGKIDRRSLPDPKNSRKSLAEVFIAPSTPMEKQLAQIWSQVLGIEEIGIYDNFFELGGHSLLSVQLLSQVREAFQVDVPLFYLLKEPTIAGLIEAINVVQNLSSAAVDKETEIDLQADVVLDPTISPKTPDVQPTTEPKHIFLTGATGFLGAFLLHELLEKTGATIHCLVRSRSLEEAGQRIQSNLERYLLWNEQLSSRIIPVLGDLTQPLLGLSDQEFSKLALKLDSIYHNGAFVNMVYPYSELRAANVLGTGEVLKLASLVKVTPVHFISTLDIFQSSFYSKMDVIPENVDLVYSEDYYNGYAPSKWVAEKLMTAARERGIPVCIYRLGMVTGHSYTGVSQTNDLMCRLIKGMIQMESAPQLDRMINMTPVDYVSGAIVHLSMQPESIGKAFHLNNSHPLHLSEFVSEIRALGYPIEQIPYDEWLSQLLQPDFSRENVLRPLSFLLTKRFEQQLSYLEISLLASQTFDCQNTIDGLIGTSIVCPPVDAQLLNVYFSYFSRSGFLQPPLVDVKESFVFDQILEAKTKLQLLVGSGQK